MRQAKSTNQQVMIHKNPALPWDSFFWILLLIFSNLSLRAQGISGYIRNEVTLHPIANATIEVTKGQDSIFMTASNEHGYYQLDIPIAGKVNIKMYKDENGSFMLSGFLLDGYSRYQVDGYLSDNGIMLHEISVQAPARDDAQGFQKITLDDLPRIAGHNDDPVRIAHSLPGIMLTNDQANHFSFRGQSPNLNTWMLEGLEIVNPNHLNNAGTFSDQPVLSGGGVNLFSAQALSSTTFFTGVAGMNNQRNNGLTVDFGLRDQHINEYRFKSGLIGIEAGLSRSLSKSWSVHANARYSFTGILTALGSDFGGEKIGFYDGVFSLTNKTPNRKFKLFGWVGKSKNDFSPADSLEEITRQKDFFNIQYKRTMGGAGLVYDQILSYKTQFNFGASWSRSSTIYSQTGQIPGYLPVNFQNDLQEDLLHLKAYLSHQIVHDLNTVVGVDYTRKGFNMMAESTYPFRDESFFRPHIELTYNPIRILEISIGAEYAKYLLSSNDQNQPGYYIHSELRTGRRTSLSFGGRRGVGQLVQTSTGQKPLVNSKAEVSYRWRSGESRKLQHQVRTVIFYSVSKNMPVSASANGVIQLADFSSEIWEPFFMNFSGSRSQQYGIEASWNASSINGWLLGANVTLLDNKRSIDDAPLESGRFSNGFGCNTYVSREIFRVRKEKNRIWHISLRTILNGGIREQQIDEMASENFGSTRYVDDNVFSDQLPIYKRIDLGIARTISREGLRWRFALDVQNVAGLKNDAFHYWDAYLKKVIVQRQLSIVPVLSAQLSFTGK